METKACGRCGEEKPLSEFGTHKRYKFGRHYNCRVCVREYFKKYRETNKDVLNKKQKVYRKLSYLKYREKNLLRAKEYAKKNPDKTRTKNKEWREKNKEHRRNYDRQRRLSTPKEKIKEWKKRDYEKNKDRYNKYNLARQKTEKGKAERRRIKKRIIENLADRYVREKLRQQGFSNDIISPELIEIKKTILKIKRHDKTTNQHQGTQG